MNASKSFIITFGNKSRSQQDLKLTMGSDSITQTDCIRHVGIFLNNKMTDSDKIDNACKKAKSSLFTLLSLNINHTILIDSLRSLIKKICIPRLLFGAELWSNLKQRDIDQLELFNKLCAKKIQNFHVRTRTDICLSMLGWNTVLSQIDLKKLSFLGRLCNMPCDLLTRKIFNTRLSLYTCRTDSNQTGFIPDIIRVLDKYGLGHYLVSYVQSGTFPEKNYWKNQCKCSINARETDQWLLRLQGDNCYARFRLLHTNIERAILWECATETSTSQPHAS